MTVEFRTVHPQLLVKNEERIRTLRFMDMTVIISGEDYDRFCKLYDYVYVNTKSELLWLVIKNGMQAIETRMRMNQKLPIEEEVNA